MNKLSIPKKAAQKAKMICRDDRHGYDNRPGYRLGNPDYACSSFVAACYRKAGVPVPANSYTQTMKKQWREFGFKDVADSVDFKTGAGMKVGDILIAPCKHTEIVVTTTHKLAGARGNPRGAAQNGRAGDQTGTEISVKKYYNDGWSQCLRYKPAVCIEM